MAGKVNSINKKKFFIKNNTVGNLIKLGFQLQSSCDDKDRYVYYFPILKYEEITTLSCELTVYEGSHEVRIDVYDGMRRPYSRFYKDEYGNDDPIISQINNMILRKFSKMGIYEKKSLKNRRNRI